MSTLMCRGPSVFLLLLASTLLPAAAEEKALTPEAALQRLKDGNARFAADKPTVKDLGTKRRIELTEKQQPFAVVLTCSDSRVVPEFIFDAGLADVFTISLAGNVTGPSVIASMEYAVGELKTPLIAVVGHTNCGAVDAALKGKELPSDNLKHLIGLIHLGDSLPKDKQAAREAAVRANVLYHTKELTRQSTILKDFAAAGRIKIVAGVYVLKTGAVEWLELPKAKP
jgi:carbonic anhydrase